jgi:cytochrome b561
MKQISRYHPLLVTLHWVLAVLIIAELSLGFFGLAATSNSDPQKIGLLRVHMPGGVLIVALTVIGFIVRMRTSRPVEATTGYPLLERIAPISYYGLYILIVLIVGTGFATAVIAGLGEIVFGPSGVPLPDSLMIYPTLSPTSCLRCSLSALSFCTCLPRSITNSSKKTDCSCDVLRATCVRSLGSCRNSHPDPARG